MFNAIVDKNNKLIEKKNKETAEEQQKEIAIRMKLLIDKIFILLDQEKVNVFEFVDLVHILHGEANMKIVNYLIQERQNYAGTKPTENPNEENKEQAGPECA